MHASRRRFLRASLGLASLSFLPLGAGCALAPQASETGTRIATGVHRIRFGTALITAVSDGFTSFPLADNFVRNVPLAQVQQALRDAGLPPDTLTIPFTAFVVETAGQRILIDAGNGQFGAATSGQLTAGLIAAGYPPAAIDHVLISHFHGDHINGLRTREGQLAYPRARVHVPQPEWDYWMNDDHMARAPKAMQAAFQNARRVFGPMAGQVHRFMPGSAPVPGVKSLAAFGHTPGHTAFEVQAGNRSWVFLADFANIAALFVRHPDWAVAFDMDAGQARHTRRELLEQAVARNWLVSGYHMPFPAIGRIVRRNAGYDFVPLA